MLPRLQRINWQYAFSEKLLMQDFLVFTLGAIAAVFLGFKLLSFFSRTNEGGCRSCGCRDKKPDAVIGKKD